MQYFENLYFNTLGNKEETDNFLWHTWSIKIEPRLYNTKTDK
jgi:hypothetical protein